MRRTAATVSGGASVSCSPHCGCSTNPCLKYVQQRPVHACTQVVCSRVCKGWGREAGGYSPLFSTREHLARSKLALKTVVVGPRMRTCFCSYLRGSMPDIMHSRLTLAFSWWHDANTCKRQLVLMLLLFGRGRRMLACHRAPVLLLLQDGPGWLSQHISSTPAGSVSWLNPGSWRSWPAAGKCSVPLRCVVGQLLGGE